MLLYNFFSRVVKTFTSWTYTTSMRYQYFVKCIIFVVLVLILIRVCLDIFIASFREMINQILMKKTHMKLIVSEKDKAVDKKLKYILQWTKPDTIPFVYMGKGQEVFINHSCKYKNCFVTSDRRYLDDVTKFDVIAFHNPELDNYEIDDLPSRRSPHQKYAFVCIESAHYYPLCDSKYNGFFNWTWTYKLDSDTRWGYLVIRDERGNIIGPEKEMHWIKKENMRPVPHKLLSILKGKTKAAVWFASHCATLSNREKFVKELQSELRNYNLSIDIYGECGKLTCPRSDERKCDRLVEKDYFFYLAFENSISDDYVTEKILHGLQYSAIPIVYGGANYTRFMPDGIYLNASELDAKKLAATMHRLINNMSEYSEYFKWRSHYSFHKREESVETDDYCGICALLNNEKKVNDAFVYTDMKKWWNNPYDRCYHMDMII